MKTMKLGELARIYNGNSINEKVKKENFFGLSDGTPYIATKDISYSFSVDYENGVSIPSKNANEFKLAKSGSVLICAEGGSAGRKMAIIDRDIFFGNKLFCFDCGSQLQSKYLFYYLQASTFQNLFKSSITGIIGGVSLEKVRNLPIFLPTIERQNEVVEKLDRVLAEIRKELSIGGEALANLRSLLDSKLEEEFLTLVDNSGTVRADSVVDVRDGTHDSPSYVESGYPLITSKNLQNGLIDFSNISFIEEDDYHAINRRSKVDVGDLLFAMIGTIGNPVVIKENPVFAIKNVALFKRNAKYDMTFLSYYLRTPRMKDKFEREAKGSTQRFLGLGYLRSLDIPNIEIEDQISFVNRLRQIEDEIVVLESLLKNKLNLLQELQDSFFSQVFIEENEGVVA